MNPDEFVGKRYRLQEKLGEGTLSVVYQAIDTRQEDRPVVVKLLKNEATGRSVEATLRFIKETQVLSKLSHPHLVKLEEIGQENERYYLVMAYEEGKPLADREKRSLSEKQVLRISIQIAEALDYIHGKGIIHKDIKPSNILLRNEPDPLSVKIIDFGLARLKNVLTKGKEEEIVGTFSYMSPEQAGILPRPVDARTDLYSLGIVLYELLAGQKPFWAENLTLLLQRQLTTIPLPLRPRRPSLPEMFEGIIKKLIAPTPEDRYPSAASLLADLQELNQRMERKEPDKPFSLATYRTAQLNIKTRLIGRESQLKFLKDKIAETSLGHGGLCFVTGESGSGKTSLVEELSRELTQKGGVFLSGHCHQFAPELPYNAVVEMITDFVSRIGSPGVPGEWASRIREAAAPSVQEILQLIPSLKEFLHQEIRPTAATDPERQRLRFLQVISSFLADLARSNEPVLIFLDDLQWADDSTIELLQELAPRLTKVPIMLIGGYRSDEVSEAHKLARSLEFLEREGFSIPKIELPLFDLSDTVEFCSEALGLSADIDMVHRFSQDIWERGNGNPFFISEIMQSYVNSGILSIEERKWRYRPPSDQKWLPATASVAETVLKHLKTLSPATHRTLEYASLLGREFTLDRLRLVSNCSAEEALNALDEGLQKHIIWEQRRVEREVRYKFIHDKVHETFRDKIDPSSLREMHEEIARHLEREAPEDLFSIARHYSEGKDPAKARHYNILAGDRAKASFAYDEAIHFYRQALRTFEKETDSSQATEIKEKLGDLYNWNQSFSSAIVIYEEIRPKKKAGIETALIDGKIAMAKNRSGKIREAVESFDSALGALGERFPTSRGAIIASLIRLFMFRAINHFFPFMRRFRKLSKDPVVEQKLQLIQSASYANYFVNSLRSLVFAMKGLDLAERSGIPFFMIYFLRVYGLFLASIPKPLFNQAFRKLDQARKIAQQTNDLWNQSGIKALAGFVCYFAADRAEAIRNFSEAIEEFGNIGDPWEATVSLYSLGMNNIRMGRFEEAEKNLLEALRRAERVQEMMATSMTLSQMVWLKTLQGKYDEAEKFAQRAIDEARRPGTPAMIQVALGHWGRLLLHKGEVREALKPLEESIDITLKNKLTADYSGSNFNGIAWAYLLMAREDRSYRPRADRALKRAIAHASAFRNHYPEVCLLKAISESDRGRQKKALDWIEKGLAAARKTQNRYDEAQLIAWRGRWRNEPKDLESARQMFEEIGCPLPFEIKETKPETVDKMLMRTGLEALIEASRIISSELDLNRLLEKILDKTIQVMRAKMGFLMLYENGVLVPKIVRGAAAEDSQEQFVKASTTVIEQVIRERKGIVVSDAQLDEALKSQASIVRGHLRSILAAPLMIVNRIIGVIYVENRLVPNLFGDDDLEILNALCVQAAISIENSFAFRKVEDQVRFRTAQLEAANKALAGLNLEMEGLLHAVSHDLKAPLLNIRGFANRLKGEAAKVVSEKGLQSLEFIDQGVSKMDAMIKSLLKISRLGKQPEPFEEVDLDQMLREIRSVVSHQLDEKQIRFIAHPLPKLKCRKNEINQVFSNLIVNAINYMGDKPEKVIEVACHPNGEQVEFEIRDTGIGIREEDFERIFHIFSRLEETPAAGEGIGLNIVRKIVQGHGGKIWVESKYGEGSSFHFTV